jgi:uncharacterized protein (DUF58 family)
MGSGYRQLKPADHQRLAPFLFHPRGAVEGRFAGRHVSSHSQRSGTEFIDTRPYMPGDQVSDIDWKAYGRTDRLYVRLFERETDMTVGCLVDASASMAYGDRSAPSKFDHACRLAAAVTRMVSAQQDRVTFAMASDGLKTFGGAMTSSQQVLSVSDELDPIEPAGKANLPVAIHQMAGQIGRRAVLVVFSDLLTEIGPTLEAMDGVVGRGGEVIVFQTLHVDERDGPSGGDAILTDPETGQRLSVHLGDVRQDYRRRAQQFIDQWASALRGRGIDHRLTLVGEEPVDVLRDYLVQRAVRA